jgi:hypothetical protein
MVRVRSPRSFIVSGRLLRRNGRSPFLRRSLFAGAGCKAEEEPMTAGKQRPFVIRQKPRPEARLLLPMRIQPEQSKFYIKSYKISNWSVYLCGRG